MAQQMITLEEAAEILGISPEELKKRLKTDPDFKRLSQIRDGSTVRFKQAAIEELARQLGMASDPGLPMAPMEDQHDLGSDDFKTITPDEKKKRAKSGADAPLEFGSDDVFSLADEPSKPAAPKSSGKLVPAKPPKPMSDSSSGSSDSDVRLDGGKSAKAKGDESVVPTEEIALDFSGPGSAAIKGGSSAKLSSPKPPSSGKLSASDSGKKKGKPSAPVGTGDSSEFELSLDADSDDFELQLNPEGGDEVELGTLPKNKDKSGQSSGKRSASGINLHDPADSGISLEKGKAKDKNKEPAQKDVESDVDFELSLDSSAATSGSKLGTPNSGKMVLTSESDSEFELTLDDSGGSSLEQAALGAAELDQSGDSGDKGDIFETDFEIPPMPDESGSEAVAIESDTDLEKSDFELEDSDVSAEEASASEVVLLEDEEEGVPAAKSKMKGRPKRAVAPTEEADVDLADVEPAEDEDASASKALKGVRGRRRTDEEEEEEAVPVGGEAPTKPWGIVPTLFLAPTFLVVMIGAITGYELLNTMWGYQQPRKPAAPLVRGIASVFDMELKDQ